MKYSCLETDKAGLVPTKPLPLTPSPTRGSRTDTFGFAPPPVPLPHSVERGCRAARDQDTARDLETKRRKVGVRSPLSMQWGGGGGGAHDGASQNYRCVNSSRRGAIDSRFSGQVGSSSRAEGGSRAVRLPSPYGAGLGGEVRNRVGKPAFRHSQTSASACPPTNAYFHASPLKIPG